MRTETVITALVVAVLLPNRHDRSISGVFTDTVAEGSAVSPQAYCRPQS